MLASSSIAENRMPDKRPDRIERKLDLLTDGLSTLALKVDGKLEQIDQKMKALEERMDAGYQRLEHKMDAGFKRLGNWLRSIETTQTAINRELSDNVENHEDRIVTLEQTINPSGPKTP
jgi:uncharacterized protein YhaN